MVDSTNTLDSVLAEFKEEWVPRLKLWQFLVVDTAIAMNAFRDALQRCLLSTGGGAVLVGMTEADIPLTNTFTRKGCTVDADFAAQIFTTQNPIVCALAWAASPLPTIVC